MVELALSFGRLLAALALVALNGFFVAAEFAYVRIRPTVVDRLVEEGRSGSRALQRAMGNLDDYLAVTQLGITLASLGLGWLGEPAVAALIEPLLGTVLPASTVHLLAIVIGFTIITFLHVVFGELAPKTFAIAKTERIALAVAWPMRFFYVVLYPGIVVFNGAANGFTRLFGVPPASESEETYTEEELRTLLAQSGRKGDIDLEAVEMVQRVFDLDAVLAREIMIPQPDVTALEADANLETMREQIVEIQHTRYPVIDRDDDDRIVGFVDAKDVVRATDAGETDVTAESLARELPVVPETKTVLDLLAQFQQEGRQMAAVVDEWGAFEGIVTVEDVVEVVVGDIRDEFDHYEPAIRDRADGTYVVDASLTVAELNDRLDTDLVADRVETVGGLILDELGEVPETGATVAVDGIALTVEGVDDNRITSVGVADVGDDEEPADADG
ncbi:hemolysin family protein [Halovivax limisalsi]|uniref:hemolysin family protein n=1 Tax=Halovivax limisalsi TaxID=1453760 RepID=UPI001FFC4A91|nr:hemolysin family protein [Halovivax limisalsi]